MLKRISTIMLLGILLTTGITMVPASAAKDFQFAEVTVDELHAGYAAKKYTAEQVVQDYLDRINTYESNYNAFTVMNPDALAQARDYRRRLAAGEKQGPLAGIPIVIKEAVDMAGFPSTMGWKPLDPSSGGIKLVPEKDARGSASESSRRHYYRQDEYTASCGRHEGQYQLGGRYL